MGCGHGLVGKEKKVKGEGESLVQKSGSGDHDEVIANAFLDDIRAKIVHGLLPHPVQEPCIRRKGLIFLLDLGKGVFFFSRLALKCPRPPSGEAALRTGHSYNCGEGMPYKASSYALRSSLLETERIETGPLRWHHFIADLYRWQCDTANRAQDVTG